IGKFMVYYAVPRALGAHQLDLARAIANHVAAAVSRFQSMAELRETVRFNEMFTGILGHDLRNPLNAIVIATRVAMARNEGDALRKPLSRIMTSSERMARMIDQLLDFTRVRLGAGIPLSLGEMDLSGVVGQVVDELDTASPEWTFRVTQAGDTSGVWDADRLSQVFSNLVANAVQHGIPAAGVTVGIDGVASDAVRVEVHNQGVIPPELLARIFEPLSGSVRRLDRARGLGLGLYISSQIVRSHGGEIAVRSDQAGGTTFTVVLPRRTPQGTAAS